MKSFFKLIRWPNLVMIVLVQYLIRFAIIESLAVPHVLNHFYFFLGVLCSVSLAAGGYVINDIMDIGADTTNKPQRMVLGARISVDTGWTIYAVLNFIAVISGYLVARQTSIGQLWLIPVVAAALLYLYSSDLKKRAVIGNLVVSILTALPIFLVAVFDVLPAATVNNKELVKPVFLAISIYAAFALALNFIREIIKDAEDIEGDSAAGYRTLAVLMGRQNVRWIIAILIVGVLTFTLGYNFYLFQSDLYSALYVSIFVNLPLAYLMIKVMLAKSKADFFKASTLTKIIMLTGILSMLVFTLSIQARF